MANKCDERIYGADDNAFAQRVASDSLKTSRGDEDIWGGTSDESARAKGNKPLDQDNDFRQQNLTTDSKKPGTSKGNH